MGRSPVLLTSTMAVCRPTFSSRTAPSMRYSPGIMGTLGSGPARFCEPRLNGSGYRMMDCDELGAVGEGGFHLDLGNHFGHALHDVVALEEVAALAHQLGH